MTNKSISKISCTFIFTQCCIENMAFNKNFHYLLHSEIKTDILQTILDEDLPKLRDIFESNYSFACQAWHVINQLMHWKKCNPDIGVRITCPEGKWDDGTFVAIITEFYYQIFFFTLDPNCKRLCQALKKTQLIEWRKGPYICAVHEDQEKIIMKTLQEVDGQIEFEIESTCWMLPKETALQYEINIPENVSIKPLSSKYASSINAIWPHKFEGSEDYLANLISLNDAYGIFTKSTSNPTLCCWVMTNDYGAVAILQTSEEHKRKGYAGLIVKYLTKAAAEDGLDSITYIVRKNIVSQTLFKGLGFKRNNNVRWVQFRQIEKRIIREY